MAEFVDTNRLLAQGADIKSGDSGIQEATIQSVGDLIRIVEREHKGSFQYRGQRSVEWKLLPTLTRAKSPCAAGLEEGESCIEKERHILKEFRTRVAAYRQISVEGELALAVLAQQHGAPTRLLDWTLNPLAALYFAVEEDDPNKQNAVVWATHGHRLRMWEMPDSLEYLNDGVHFVIPNYDENRAAVQSSIFAVWRHPQEPMEKVAQGLWKITVPDEKRKALRWILHCLGINRETLFPDLDGLGRYLAWKHGRIHQKEYSESRDSLPRPK